METDILTLIADLEAHIEASKKVPLTNQFLIDRDVVLSIIQTIRDALPEEIKEANRVLKQESRILQDAKKHAENQIAEADAKARMLRMESEQRAESLTTGARKQADELVDDAQRKAEDTVDAAERKAEELVAQTSIVIRAEQQANEILTNARGEAQRTRMATLDHCADLLKHAEDVAIEIANELRDSRMQMDQER